MADIKPKRKLVLLESVFEVDKKSKQEEEKESKIQETKTESKEEIIEIKLNPQITDVWLNKISDPVWKEVLKDEFESDYFKSLLKKLQNEWDNNVEVYPPKEQIFRAFEFFPFQDTKVIIIGQDCYHGPGQAHGLAFSVPFGVTTPPSLKNIFKELSTDIQGFKEPNHGNLEHWAKQGVLLINSM